MFQNRLERSDHRLECIHFPKFLDYRSGRARSSEQAENFRPAIAVAMQALISSSYCRIYFHFCRKISLTLSRN
jgi:hypothetical protein